jgi:hypothetical protein
LSDWIARLLATVHCEKSPLSKPSWNSTAFSGVVAEAVFDAGETFPAASTARTW